METGIEERMEKAEARLIAHGLLIRFLFETAFPDAADRRQQRTIICDQIEGMYGAGEITDHDRHLLLQRILGTVEQIVQ